MTKFDSRLTILNCFKFIDLKSMFANMRLITALNCKFLYSFSVIQFIVLRRHCRATSFEFKLHNFEYYVDNNFRLLFQDMIGFHCLIRTRKECHLYPSQAY